MIEFVVNQKPVRVEVEDDTPLLWVLRENLGLTGTKFGCGIAMCGACTVHMNGQSIRACVTKVAEIAGREITTIEGLNGGHPLQQAWVDESVPQCGYCQPGQIMQAAALLAVRPNPSDDDIDQAMAGNLCRCGTYQRIRRAIHRAAGQPVASSNRRVLRVVQGEPERSINGALTLRQSESAKKIPSADTVARTNIDSNNARAPTKQEVIALADENANVGGPR